MTEYALYMDDGNGGTLSEIDTSTVRGSPQTLSHSVTTFPANSEGKTFMFQIEVFTAVGSTKSESVGFPLASVPTTPSAGPVSDSTVTSNSAIKVDVTAVSTFWKQHNHQLQH